MAPEATAVMTPAAMGYRRRVDHWFYVVVGLAMTFFNVVAFGPSIVNPSTRLGSFTWLVAAHGVVSFAFVLFFLAQSVLVATGRTSVHRRIGFVGAALAGVMLVSGYFMSMELLRRGHDLSGDLLRLERTADAALVQLPPGPQLAINFSLFGAFGILVGAGIVYRRRPAIHKRLMLLAMVGVLPGPPYAHLIGHWPVLVTMGLMLQLPITVVCLSLSAIRDCITEGRIHPVSLWGAILLFIWSGVWLGVIGPSAAWNELTMRLLR
jgi:hypothetical protein